MVTLSTDRRERIAALEYDYDAQPKQALTSCNLCGAAELVILTHRDRYGYPAQAHACRRCGLVFLNPRMTAEAYGRFYNGIYRPLVSAFHGRLIDAHTIQAEQREYAIERAGFVRPFMAKTTRKTLLDIGGSTRLAAPPLVKEFGLQGAPIDPAPLQGEEATRLGPRTRTGLSAE